MAESILRLKVNSEEYNNKLKQATEQLARYADGCRKAGGTLQYVDDNIVEFTRSLGRMETTATTARGKVAELTKSYTELAVQYKNMTDEEKKGDYGKALAASLDQLKGRIGESKMQLDDINKSINGGGGLTGALDAVAGKFGLSIEQFTKFGGVAGVASTALKVAKDAFFQSESNIDEWGRTVEGAKGAYSLFLDTLNNGNWSNFFQNLSTAIRGGRDLYDVFDRLGSIKSNNAAAIAITQKEIAELRLAKQQGENVDAKLKSATERLAALQKQSVSAGMTAGSTSAFQTIRNSVNSIGGAGVNDATIQYAVNRIMKFGQAEFDRYKRNYDVLRQRGTGMTTSYQTTAYGGTMAVQKREFNISNLTQEEQKQYALAKAITEGETRIQKGIAAYAQAGSEGTASAREEFKGNRYALQGAGGSGSSRSSGSSKTNLPTLEDFWLQMSKNDMKLQDQKAAGDLVKDMPSPYQMMFDEIKKQYLDKKDFDLGKDISKEWKVDSKGNLTNKSENRAQESMARDLSKFTGYAEKTLGGVSSIVGGLSQLGVEIPKGLQDVLGGIQGITSIVTGIASLVAMIEALSTVQTTESTIKSIPVIGWALAGGGIIHAANGYVPGNNYSGDQVPALLNSGELVLNKAQQNALANELQGNGMQNMRLRTEVSGRNLIVVIENDLKARGKGQLATFKG